jgi:hypothetical protein
MDPLENFNKQIKALRDKKANLSVQTAQIDTQIAQIETQKANLQKTLQAKKTTVEKVEIDEDGEVVTDSTGPDGAINDTTLGDYKYYPKIGQTIQRDYKRTKKSRKKNKYTHKESVISALQYLQDKVTSL